MPNLVDKTKTAVSAPGAFSRIGGQPLDYTSIFNNYDDMVKYAADPNGQAYVGQLITLAVNGKPAELYVVCSSSLGEHKVDGVAYGIYVEKVKQGDSVPAFGDYESIVKNAYDNRDKYADGQLFVHTTENTVYSFIRSSCGTLTVTYGDALKDIPIHVIPVAYKAPVFESYEDLIKFSESEKGGRLAYTLAVFRDYSSKYSKVYCITGTHNGSVNIDGTEHFNYTVPISQPRTFDSYDNLVIFASGAVNHCAREFAIVTAPYPALYYIDTASNRKHVVNGVEYDVYVRPVSTGTRTFSTYEDLVKFSGTSEGRVLAGSYAIVADGVQPPRMYVITENKCGTVKDANGTSYDNYTSPATPTATFQTRNDLIRYAAKPENRLFPTIALVLSSPPSLYYIVQSSSSKVTVDGVEYDNYTVLAHSDRDFPAQDPNNELVPAVSATSGEVYGVVMSKAAKASSIPQLDSSGRLKVNSDADLSKDARYVPSRKHVENMVSTAASELSLSIAEVKQTILNNLDSGTTIPHLSSYIANRESMYTYWSEDSPGGEEYRLTAERGTLLCVTYEGYYDWYTYMVQLGITGFDTSGSTVPNNKTYKSPEGKVTFEDQGVDTTWTGTWDSATKVYGKLTTDGGRVSFRVVWGKIYKIH